MNTDIIIVSFLLGWWLSNFEPLQLALDIYVRPSLRRWRLFTLSTSLRCHKCISFWSALTLGLHNGTFTPWEAMAAAVIAATYTRLMASLPTNHSVT